MITMVLAADPGMTTGLCILKLVETPPGPGTPVITERLVFSCNADAAYPLASWLLEANEGPARIVAVGEAFVHGRGAGARGPGAAATRAVIQELAALPVPWKWRAAGMVKPWATDKRLEKTGLLAITAKMVDARDAARHALFAAVHDCGLPDPLSRRGRIVAVPDDLGSLLCSWTSMTTGSAPAAAAPASRSATSPRSGGSDASGAAPTSASRASASAAGFASWRSRTTWAA